MFAVQASSCAWRLIEAKDLVEVTGEKVLTTRSAEHLVERLNQMEPGSEENVNYWRQVEGLRSDDGKIWWPNSRGWASTDPDSLVPDFGTLNDRDPIKLVVRVENPESVGISFAEGLRLARAGNTNVNVLYERLPESVREKYSSQTVPSHGKVKYEDCWILAFPFPTKYRPPSHKVMAKILGPTGGPKKRNPLRSLPSSALMKEIHALVLESLHDFISGSTWDHRRKSVKVSPGFKATRDENIRYSSKLLKLAISLNGASVVRTRCNDLIKHALSFESDLKTISPEMSEFLHTLHGVMHAKCLKGWNRLAQIRFCGRDSWRLLTPDGNPFDGAAPLDVGPFDVLPDARAAALRRGPFTLDLSNWVETD